MNNRKVYSDTVVRLALVLLVGLLLAGCGSPLDPTVIVSSRGTAPAPVEVVAAGPTVARPSAQAGLTAVATAQGSPVVPAASAAPATPAPTSDVSEAPADWKAYDSVEGAFSFSYPANATFYEGEVPGVDGVLAPAPNTVALKQAVAGGSIVSITYKPLKAETSPAAFAAQDDSCVAKASSQPYTLAGEPALLFEDTPCGPYGSTVIYATHGRLGYRIEILTGGGYQSAKSWVSSVLGTLKFG